MAEREIERLVQLLAKLPGLGPRSARRAVLQLLKRREGLLQPLAAALNEAGERVRVIHLKTSRPPPPGRVATRDNM